MKRATFQFATIPATPTASQLASLTFTPPVSGTAVLSARGYCNMTPIAGSDNEINIAIGSTLAVAFNGGVAEWGVLNVPSGSTAGLHQLGWTAETTVAVTAGTSYTRVLAGRHEMGATSTDCSGSFKVEVYTGTLP